MMASLLPIKSIGRLRDIIDTMHDTSVHIFEEKKRALKGGDEVVAKQFGGGKDIMSILSTSLSFGVMI